MTTSKLIREAKSLDLHGAQPGAAATVNRVVKALEEERALRLRLQRELNDLKRNAQPVEFGPGPFPTIEQDSGGR